MKLKKSSLLVAGLLLSALGISSAYAVTPTTVTFEPDTFATTDSDILSISSNLGTSKALLVDSAPSIYVAAGSAQTITTNDATFNGGVLLGLATFFPAQAFASGANVYGTADFGDTSLKNVLSFSTNQATNQVGFALFNGETFTQNYQITANVTNGTATTDVSILSGDILANWQSGYTIMDLNYASLFPLLDPATANINFNINSVSISAVNNATNLNGLVYDFLIDTVVFNGALTAPINPPTVTYTPPLQNPESPIVVQAPELQLTENQRAVIDYGIELDRTQETHVSILTDLKDVNKCGGKKGCIPDFQVQFETDKNGNVLIDPITLLPIHKFELEFEDVILAALPVPEPESYAMMLTGFGVMGFVARRRRIVS